MTVTTTSEVRLGLAEYWSIVLAVGQWRRNSHLTLAAIVRLRGLGIGETEILARRRASSSDARLAALLRLAVTIVISGGALTAPDRRPLRELGLQPLLPQIEAYTADALAFSRAIAATGGVPAAPLDMEIGDY